MNIGFYIKWAKGSLDRKEGNVIGDELLSLSMIKYLHKIPKVHAELYSPNFPPSAKLDVMIYMNDVPLQSNWARKHVIYIQNGYASGGDAVLRHLASMGFDGFILYSSKLLELHKSSGGEGIYLPFGVDTELFYPRPIDSAYMFECAYIGNDIKGKDRTEQFIMPAVNYNFGLFGNWHLPGIKYQIKQLIGLAKPWDAYQIRLGKIAKGKIPQEDVPKLYSSAKINLNCTIQDCVDMDVITLRTFEILACKGFLITDRVPAAEKILQGCVVFTDGGKDLDDKIKYYLAHSEERTEIAERGYQYVVKYATIEARVNELYAYLTTIAKGR
ncbi:MAG: glycosyltransferase [Prevotella sp.]|jgi:spore maturation protein CgeB|nr:glycosyltransferase [Prevotella sp.]